MSVIKNIIPVSGKWFVMLVDENDRESCNPHPIAAWATVEVDGDNDDDVEVHPLIAPPDSGYAMNQLTIPSKDDVIGIADAKNVTDSFWNDLAKEKAKIDDAEQQRERATAQNVDYVTEQLCKIPDSTHRRSPQDFVDKLLQIREHRPYMIDKDVLALDANHLVEARLGGYAITKLGEMFITRHR